MCFKVEENGCWHLKTLRFHAALHEAPLPCVQTSEWLQYLFMFISEFISSYSFFLNLWEPSARRHATINKLPRFKSNSFFSKKAPVPFGPVSVLLVRLLTQASGPSSRGSVILTLMTWQRFPKQTRLLEILMEEEFKELFFPFKSLENPPLHLHQPLNRLMVQASHSGSSCSLTSLPKRLN